MTNWIDGDKLLESLIKEQRDYSHIIMNARWEGFKPLDFNEGIETAKDLVRREMIMKKK